MGEKYQFIVGTSETDKKWSHLHRRRSSRRRLAFVVASFLTLTLLAACGDTAEPGVTEVGTADSERAEGESIGGLNEYRENGVRVGLADIPPLSFLNGSEAAGSEPDITRFVLGRLGISFADTTLADFSSLIPGLQADRYDVIPTGAYVNPDRCDAVEFSHPTAVIMEMLVYQKGNPSGITSFDDVAADPTATIGIIAGSAVVEQMLEAGIDPNQISEFPELLDGLDALAAGRIDVMNSDNIAMTYSLSQGGYDNLEGGEPFSVDADVPVAIAIAFRDPALRDAFNEELRALQEQDLDTLVEIGAPYGLTRSNYEDAAAYDIGELCELLRTD